MVWQNGGPGSRVPIATKRVVFSRQGGACATVDAAVCLGIIQDYDHLESVKAAGLERHQATHPDLFRGLCRPCHKKVTQAQAIAAKKAKWTREPIPHPGLYGGPNEY